MSSKKKKNIEDKVFQKSCKFFQTCQTVLHWKRLGGHMNSAGQAVSDCVLQYPLSLTSNIQC